MYLEKKHDELVEFKSQYSKGIINDLKYKEEQQEEEKFYIDYKHKEKEYTNFDKEFNLIVQDLKQTINRINIEKKNLNSLKNSYSTIHKEYIELLNSLTKSITTRSKKIKDNN